MPDRPGDEETPAAFAQQLAHTQPPAEPTPPPPKIEPLPLDEQPVFTGVNEWSKSETKKGG